MLSVDCQKNREECCGCSLCENVCPAKAITMSFSHGKLLPQIDNTRCKSCGICYRVCEASKHELRLQKTTNTFIGKSKNKNVLDSSSSGGIFYEIASKFIKNGGIVYSSFSKDGFSCETIRCVNDLTLISTLKSKYVQSYQGGIFLSLSKDLEEGKKVLICTTPCYLNAIKEYLRIKKISDSNLFCIDFLCSGFIKEDLLAKAKNAISSYTKSDIKSIVYRDKKRIGWGEYKFIFESNKGSIIDSTLYDFFAMQYATNQNCFDCPFAKEDRVGDITLGDAWGRKKYKGYVEDNVGTSVIYLNSSKGTELMDAIDAEIVEQDANGRYLEPRYCSNSEKPCDYSQFYVDFNKLNYIDLIFRYTYDDSFGTKMKKLLYKFKIKKLWKTTK